ncbi:MAG: adenosylcobinamide-GDP ribazoletransferase [Candidatus Methanoplasma sp.]|jgi:adenosylcobinamide-GDP ribazoletransferase|nr:adenosylcobinamide-GDP ribazoletransferase [Candidatus Methanoplasma sp.]
MSEEKKDQPENRDTPAVTGYEPKGDSEIRRPDGQDPVKNTGETVSVPEEEPVGAGRPNLRTIRKMNASDFRVKHKSGHEPKQESAGQSDKPSERTPARDRPTVAAHSKPVPPAAEEHPPAAPKHVQASRPEPSDSGGSAKGNSSGGFMDSIRGMLSFFTIFKINVGSREIEAMNKNFYLAPFAGLAVGLIAAVICFILLAAGADAVVAIATLATVFLLSKFLHFDGLADFGDGMIAGGDRESSIRALKDTRIGAGGFGVALVVTSISIAALTGIWYQAAAVMVIPAMEIFSKNAMVSAAAFGEPGTGMASEQVRNADARTMLMSTVFSVVFAFAAYLIMAAIGSVFTDGGYFSSEPLIRGAGIIVASAVVSVLVGWFMAHISNKKFGFVNGDVLGATNEIARALMLIAALIIMAGYLPSISWNELWDPEYLIRIVTNYLPI